MASDSPLRAWAFPSGVLFLGETFSGRELAAYYHAAKSLIAPLARASLFIPVWNHFFASGVGEAIATSAILRS